MNPPSPTVWQVIVLAISLIGGLSVVGAIFFTGIWYRILRNNVRTEIKVYNGEPEVEQAFEREVARIIENNIARRDGLIHVEITKQVDAGNQKVLGEIQKLREDLSQVSEIGERIGHIEGSVAVIMNALRVSPPHS